MRSKLAKKRVLLLALTLSAVKLYNSLRRRHYVTRSALLPPDRSPWTKLYEDGDDVSFLNIPGFSRHALTGSSLQM
jgi:hypothetical protein